jgi:MFS family permease
MMSPFVSQLGLSVYLIGLNWLIVEATGTTKQLGIIQAVSGVAFIITDVFVGVLVDKYRAPLKTYEKRYNRLKIS